MEKTFKDKKKDGKIEPVFSSLAVLDESRKAPGTDVPLPSPQAVSNAKEWVDHNEK